MVVMVALSVPIIVTVTDRESAFCAEIPPPDQGGEGAQCELKFHCLLYVLLYEVTNRLSFLCVSSSCRVYSFSGAGKIPVRCTFSRIRRKGIDKCPVFRKKRVNKVRILTQFNQKSSHAPTPRGAGIGRRG